MNRLQNTTFELDSQVTPAEDLVNTYLPDREEGAHTFILSDPSRNFIPLFYFQSLV